MKIELDEAEVCALVKTSLGSLVPEGYEVSEIKGKSYNSELTVMISKIVTSPEEAAK